jgi:hypothetical protein
MKLKQLSLALSLLLFAGNAFAQGPAGAGTKSTENPVSVVKRPKKAFIIRFVVAGAACGVGIGLSANPATTAEIGLPILLGGNYLAFRLYQNHPKWSAFVQAVSPLGCFGYKGHPHKFVKKPTSNNPPPSGNPPPNPGGNPPPGPGSNPPPPSGGGNPPPPTGGGNPPPGPGGNPGGGNPPPGNGGGCIQDCGLPGNGGVNGGRDINKPPFPGKPHRPGA